MHNVPFIRFGIGVEPRDGGCIMQIVDWLDREGWTDQPECVHPVLRKLAIYANDALPDGERQKLLDLTGRLMGTNTGGKEMSARLATFVARLALGTYEERFPNDDRPRRAIESAERWADNPSNKNAAAAATAAYAANAAANDANAASYASNAAYAAYAANAAANAANAASNAAYASNAANAAAYAAAYAAYAASYASNAAAAAAAANAAANAAYAASNAAIDEANADNAAYAASNAAGATAAFNLLLDTLDEYDRLSGRERVCAVDLGPVAEMLELARA